ncbi:MAG: CBS domain-containing protein [Kofleriaceae bacterium]
MQMLRARDLMQPDVVTVGLDTPILDVHRLFVEEEIHGAPVIDRDENVCGVVTSLDLVRATREALEPGAALTATSTYFHDELSVGAWMHLPDDLQNKMANLCARDVMTSELVMVPADMPLAEVATKMLDQRVHRVLVGTRERMIGVLSTFDFLRVVAQLGTAPRQTGYSR